VLLKEFICGGLLRTLPAVLRGAWSVLRAGGGHPGYCAYATVEVPGICGRLPDPEHLYAVPGRCVWKEQFYLMFPIVALLLVRLKTPRLAYVVPSGGWASSS